MLCVQAPSISGQPKQSLSLYTAGSVCVVCAGLAVFSWEPEVSQQRTYTLQADTDDQTMCHKGGLLLHTDDQMRCHVGATEESYKAACTTSIPETT